MEMQEIIEQAEQNIRTALEDYGRHTRQRDVLDDVSEKFIKRLAKDSSIAKQGLRELFSKSPVWNAKLDALVINGTRTHNPDYNRIERLACQILYDPMHNGDRILRDSIVYAIRFFSEPNADDYMREQYIAAIKRLAPKAYAPSRKQSRIFKSLCDALGVTDESAGSEFQRLFAQFADELNSRKIGFKLFVSINPAHFISMSNPKCDDRGSTLTSCHSFNSTEYEYNNGCTGYARDDVSFIVFTVADPTDAETLNNRKTTRQIFAYRPGSGLLLQSRMYNTSGGVYGAAEDSKLYRDLVQREISALENVPNLWKTTSSTGDRGDLVFVGDGFGGYHDWTYPDFDGHISTRVDFDQNANPLDIGTWGLCVMCGCETSHGVYCEDCDPENRDTEMCDDCEEYAEELFDVRNSSGEWIRVCERCCDENYTYCDVCGEYHSNDNMNYIDGRDVCDSCLSEYYEECEECGEYHRREDMHLAHNGSREVYVCDDCMGDYYTCDRCDELYHGDDVQTLHKADGDVVTVCDDCARRYETCPHCGDLIEVRNDGTCPACGAVVEENEKEEAV